MIDKIISMRLYIFCLCLVTASLVEASDAVEDLDSEYLRCLAGIMDIDPPELVNYKRDTGNNAADNDFDSTYNELIDEQFSPADALLYAAIREDLYLGDEECLRLCQKALNENANLEKELDGKTALMHAASGGNVKVMELLLHNGANINALSEDGEDVLTVAMSAPLALIETAKFLLEKGALFSDEHIDLANELAEVNPDEGWKDFASGMKERAKTPF